MPRGVPAGATIIANSIFPGDSVEVEGEIDMASREAQGVIDWKDATMPWVGVPTNAADALEEGGVFVLRAWM